MAGIPDLAEELEVPDEIVQSGLKGELVIFVGAGASRLVGLPSWAELAENVLTDLRNEGRLGDDEIWQLKKLDPRKKLSIASQIAGDSRIKRYCIKHLAEKGEGAAIYEEINSIGCCCITTNYDELLAPRLAGTHDESSSSNAVTRVFDRDDFSTMLLDKLETVIHLHGSISRQESMILTTKDYLCHYNHEKVKLLLEDLFTRKTVLFIGYGLEEAEIMEHIFRRNYSNERDLDSPMKRRFFSLQGFVGKEKFLYKNLYTYYRESYDLELLGFLRGNDNHEKLADLIEIWAGRIEVSESIFAR